MALVVADRVQETTNTTGTGAYALGGAVTGFQTFASEVSDADTVYYSVTDNVDFEVGLGTYASSGGTITRTTVFTSSNSNNAVNWGAGQKNIFLTYPADKAVIEDASNNVTIGNNLVVTGNATFADNGKAIFGAGSDLQLYHDGSNSYVSDQGTGQLVLLSNSFRLNNAANSENIITAEENGAVSLFFNDSSKLATTATGVDVNGQLTSSGNMGINTTSPAPDYGSDVALEIKGASSPGLVINDTGQASKYGIHADSNDLKITYGTGALVTFQNDGNVGIGDSSPSRNLTVSSSSQTDLAIIAGASSSAQLQFGDSSDDNIGQIEYSNSTNHMAFYTNAAERMRIDSSGHVLINNTAYSANGTLVVQQTADSKGVAIIDSAEANTFFLENDGTINKIRNNSTVPIAFETNSAERMRIDSSGRVLIGTTTEGHADGDNFTIAGSGNTGMTIRSTNSQKSTIYFSDSTSGTGEYAGYIHYDHSGNNLNIGVNENERMRIDSSGRLLVAKTTTAFGTVGHTIWNDGSHDLTASAIPSIQANRLTSDGDIIALYKDSSKMGSLGNAGTNFIIQQSNSGGVIQLKNHDNTEDIEFGQDYFRIKQGGAQRMYMDSAGVTTFSTKVNVTAADGVRDADYVATFQNQEATSGRNFGVSIAGGTSTADFALNVVNGAANTALLRVDGVGNTSISGTIKSIGGGLISSDGTADTLVISGSNAVNTGGSITLEGNAASDVSQIKFKNGSTEVMRAASGKLYFGTSGADPSSSQTGVRISSTDNTNFWMSSTPRTSAYDQLAFFNGNGLVGTITTSGSATAYNTSSDYRLKTDAKPMTGASERVQALNPVNFEWVADGTRVDGFLAHEAQAVVPESVTGTKDAVDADGNPEYQSIDQSKLVPLLTAALQEALTKIDSLETRLTALEGA